MNEQRAQLLEFVVTLEKMIAAASVQYESAWEKGDDCSLVSAEAEAILFSSVRLRGLISK